MWGLDAQKRLRAARVCLLGVSGLGAEVAKNLVLAGINSMEMVDSETVSDQDATSQFLAPRDQLGQNRAEASLQRLQQLNPMVIFFIMTNSNYIHNIMNTQIECGSM